MSERLKKWFPLWKHILAVVVFALFLALILWNRRHFTGYFPEWLSRRMGSHIWAGVIALVLAYWGKWAVASGLTLGWVAGVPIAQIIGDHFYTPMQIIDDVIFGGHKHAYIWWMCIAVGVVLGIVVQFVVWLCRKDRTRLPPVDNQDLIQKQAN